jgi:hypothetical protein
MCDGAGVLLLTPRYAAQQLGTEWGRHCYAQVWTNLAFRRVNELFVARPSQEKVQAFVMERCDLVIMADVRLLDEAKAIREAGGFIVKLERPQAGLEGDAAKHATERDFADPEAAEWVNHTIVNDGTLVEFKQQVSAALALLRV